MTPPAFPAGFSGVVFDLDGTLVDSLPGIEASLRATLAAHQPGRVLPPGGLRPLVGPPLAGIIRALWPDLGPGEVAALVAAYRTHYLAENCAATPPFPGVPELLRDLHGARVRLFVLTNKPCAQTGLIFDRQGWTGYFEEVGCPDDPLHPFADKAAGAVSLRERRGLDPARTLLVGDAADDARAAEAAGFRFAGAGYGYGNVRGHGSSLEGQMVIGTPAELRSLILPEPSRPAHDHPQPV